MGSYTTLGVVCGQVWAGADSVGDYARRIAADVTAADYPRMDIQKRIGRILKRERERQGYTALSLGMDVGMSDATIFRIEQGEQGSPINKVALIAERLGAPLWEMFAEAEGALESEALALARSVEGSGEAVHELVETVIKLRADGALSDDFIENTTRMLKALAKQKTHPGRKSTEMGKTTQRRRKIQP